jgi:hypothetical protein
MDSWLYGFFSLLHPSGNPPKKMEVSSKGEEAVRFSDDLTSVIVDSQYFLRWADGRLGFRLTHQTGEYFMRAGDTDFGTSRGVLRRLVLSCLPFPSPFYQYYD